MTSAALPATHPATHWEPVPGFLNAATMGVPPREVVATMSDALAAWAGGRALAVDYDAAVRTARERYADLVLVPQGWVAVGSQTSVLVGQVAASLPDGAEVVTVADDFTSVVFPFLVQAGRLSVRQVPLEQLAEAVGPDTALVAFSLAQSRDGRLADVEAVLDAARRHRAFTLCDTTQAAGWLAVDATRFDLTVCAAYKWLCQPRGTAYLTVRPEHHEWLVPVNAGWYAGESVWESTYGPDMRLASDARRYDVSPAWLCWTGAAAAGEVFASLPRDTLRWHGATLTDGLRERLGRAPTGLPVLALPDPDGRVGQLLSEAGLTVARRGGMVRIAFHLWNTADDVDRVADALGS